MAFRSKAGPDIISAHTRQFMALLTIVQRHCRPGTPTRHARRL
jgi:hypothetical protein